MTRYLGGPESHQKLIERQDRYERPGSGQFRIVDVGAGEGVGWVGYWERKWQGADVYEIGWSVVPAWQGRGYATAGARLVIERMKADDRRGSVHAFPSVDNLRSNAVCRRIGFNLVGECDFEYPPGNPMKCNDWQLEL